MIHNPKTAGTTLSRALCLDDSIHHLNCEECRLRYGQLRWDEYFRFTFVRNPLARLVSSYTFARYSTQIHNDREFATRSTFKQWVDTVTSTTSLGHPSWCAQHHWADPNMLNFTGRFENLQHDYELVCHRANIKPPPKLLRLNISTTDKPWQEYYDPDSLEKAQKFYAKDFEMFDYEDTL
tara:strand:- start:25 stop:564 length:540 start_codon:yes stop_codon:yes gene_type:complete